MAEIEILTTHIGEFVSMMEEADRIEYINDNGKMTAFTIFMKSGNMYSLTIK
ncbi:MAG: hypothetical protein FWE03_03490 [Firmicutes bacterium]|nr:hypothetical protein [Bacillota bacterium]